MINNGGAETALINTINNLDANKYTVTVIALFKTDKLFNSFRENVEVKYIFPFYFKGVPLIFKFFRPDTLYKRIIKKHYDVEIAYIEGVTTRIISGSTNKKSTKIAWVHTDLKNNNRPARAYLSLNEHECCYSKFDKIVFVSEGNREGFCKIFGNENLRKIVIHNVIDYSSIIKRSDMSLYDFKRDKEFLFCSIGRISYEKGYDRLIEAVRIVSSKGKHFKLIIIGDGSDHEKIRAKIKKYNLENIIYLLGYKDNPLSYLANSDCYICSSRAEGLSTSTIEAVTLQIPVLTTDCAGMKEILENGKLGLIVENSTEGLVSGIDKMISDSCYNMKLKKNLHNHTPKFTSELFKEKFDVLVTGD
jgi:glycosyltransferase involved in cell wall biosynthesis